MKRTVWLLFCCQALMSAVTLAQVATGALIAHSLATNKMLATLPAGINMAAAMAASVVAAAAFERFGRKAGFLLGTAASTAGCLVFAAALWRGDFALQCAGAVPAGLGFGIMQHLRFAAAEAAGPSARTRAIALVMAGGVAGAFVGPELVRRTADLFAPALFLGTYLCLAAVPAVVALLLAFADLPPPARRTGTPAPLRAIVGRPAFIAAAAAGMAAHAAMNLVMASAPVQMALCGFGVADGLGVMRAHAVAMFAPGFATGLLVERFGAARVVCAGGLLCFGSAALSAGGAGHPSFLSALALLGLGWNLMFTGATALLAGAHGSADRVRAQAANDALVSGAVACTAFGSGLLHGAAGWVALNLATVPLLLAGMGAVSGRVVALRRRTRPEQISAAPISRARTA
jgi:MFS family permease